MSRTPSVTRAVLDRTLAALKAAGVEVTGARVEAGAVIFLTSADIRAQDSPRAALDAWREQRDGARAAQGS
jgi:hypothetical protein